VAETAAAAKLAASKYWRDITAADISDAVGRCMLSVSKPAFKAPMVSALEAKM